MATEDKTDPQNAANPGGNGGGNAGGKANGNAAGGNQGRATALLSQIPLGAIIGAPLLAAVDAQGRAAMACYNFIKQQGRDPQKGGDVEGPTNIEQITFTFERKSIPAAAAPQGGTGAGTNVVPANGAPPPALAPGSVTTITVPLLTVMPLPFIRIESMTLNFKASISAVDEAAKTETQSKAGEGKLDGTLGFGWWKVNVGGSISSKKDSTATNTSKYSVEHTIDISVHAVQEDMPAGLARLLALLTENIAVTRA